MHDLLSIPNSIPIIPYICLMADLSFPLRYLKHLVLSKTKYGVHSPFVYEFITNVLEDNTLYAEYRIAETIKKEMLDSDAEIQVTDFGTGGKRNHGNRRKISNIAASSSKPAKQGRLLHRIIKYFQPATIFELGTSLGISSLYMATANRNSRLITLEGCPELSSVAASNFRKAGVKNISVITGNIDETLPPVCEQTQKAGFVFFDANHRLEPTIRYFRWFLEKRDAQTVFVFDDIHWSTEMETAWKNISAHPDVTLSIDIFWFGIVFFGQELTKQHFFLKY